MDSSLSLHKYTQVFFFNSRIREIIHRIVIYANLLLLFASSFSSFTFLSLFNRFIHENFTRYFVFTLIWNNFHHKFIVTENLFIQFDLELSTFLESFSLFHFFFISLLDIVSLCYFNLFIRKIIICKQLKLKPEYNDYM